MNAAEKLLGTDVYTDDAEESDDTSGWAREKARERGREKEREDKLHLFNYCFISSVPAPAFV